MNICKKFLFFPLLTLIIFGPTQRLNAALLDKIISVFNETIITQSMVDRISENYNARKFLAGEIYNLKEINRKTITDLIIKRFLIREKLKNLGIVISDKIVNGEIKNLKAQRGFNQNQLLGLLAAKNITYPEYLEVMKEAIEYRKFFMSFIRPLVTVSNQEIKNLFIKSNSKDKTISYKYNIIDYTVSVSSEKDVSFSELLDAVKKYHNNKPLPPNYSQLRKNNLGDLNEDDLNIKIKTLLKPLGEGEFSTPLFSNNQIHVFYIKRKNITESGVFKKLKDMIRSKIITTKSKIVLSSWVKREKRKYYIKYFFNKAS
jgi:peptidyl-prolyl cis-trans isomerase SurA